MISRRKFVAKGALVVGLVAIAGKYFWDWVSIKNTPPKKIEGKILGATHTMGHRLREAATVLPEEEVETVEYVIVGGGIAALSAARWLRKNSIDSFRMLELEKEVGGNSSYGKNEVSVYPWGAHYLPLPNGDFTELIDFLKEVGVIETFNADGLPVFNDYYLCFDPDERLYIHNHWQEGLVPNFGLTNNDLTQIGTFLQKMKEFSIAKGNDGKYAFAIPLDRSSSDMAFTDFDQITMADYLQRNGFNSEYLKWYVDYCCRDDYGSNSTDVSAWAGIHYFASRKGIGDNAKQGDVLTWPEGNGWLMNQLKQTVGNNVLNQSLAYQVGTTNEGVFVDYWNDKEEKFKRLRAKKCIMATPQFVNQYVLDRRFQKYSETNQHFTYAPWMVANIVVNDLHEKRGETLSWDNVIYNSTSLGYVCANHQVIDVKKKKQVLTYYLPLCDKDPTSARKEAIQKTHEQWCADILKDLRKIHPNIDSHIENIDIWIWGHGMIRPIPGFITGLKRKQIAEPIENKIFFAHSDLSGVSIFEEAFYQGIKAVNQSLGKTT